MSAAEPVSKLSQAKLVTAKLDTEEDWTLE